MKKLIIYGCGYPSIISLINYLNTKKPTWEIMGFLDDSKYGVEKNYMGVPIVGGRNNLEEFVRKGYYFLNNVASSTKNIEAVFNSLVSVNAKIATLIFPELPDFDQNASRVGVGSFISPHVVIGAQAVIGRNVVIRPKSMVSHDSEIGDFCFIGPDVTVLRRVKIGDNTYLGAKSLIRNDITIGKNCVIGMGAVVTKDIPDNTVVVGNPAKPIKKNASN